MTQFLTYHNDPAVEQLLKSRIAAHQAADEIVKGQYWQNGKGCAVGCSLHSSDHLIGEIAFGIPLMLWRLEDVIFERLPDTLAMTLPARFANAARRGSDMSLVGWQFLHWLIDVELLAYHDHPALGSPIKQCAAVLLARSLGGNVSTSEAADAEYAADAAEYAAAAAAAANVAANVARAAATRTAADAAGYATRAAAAAAEYAEYAAADTTRTGAYIAAITRMSEKLLELMAAAPIPTQTKHGTR